MSSLSCGQHPGKQIYVDLVFELQLAIRPPHDGSVLVDPSLQILGLTNRRHRSVEALEMDGVHQSDLTLARVASDPSNMRRTSAYRSAMERHQLQFRVSLRSLAYMMPHPDI
jgi:hypothetical protein